MNEPITGDSPSTTQAEVETERTKQVSTAGWTAGTTAFFGFLAVNQSPAWPTAFGVAAVSAMVAVVCLRMLKR
ncbi:MAG TPA: hypothetical protein VMB21_02005 [Candidatus Limnocylindria bacterium]|jgi:hypothetical protein|nr:hypothetical protein [Candidatus Limnocylindria bacterium]